MKENINGKRNGKGKEYNHELYNKLIFEGEYLNGKRWNGKGEEYNIFGKLIFAGKYINGLRNGIGKEYGGITNTLLISEFEYLNGKKMNLKKK